MKIILGKQIEEVKKKDSETEKNLLKNRNSEDINDLDKDDIYFHSNTIKNIKLGTNTVNRIYLNNSIVYELENTIDSNLFHSLVPNTATEIRFLYASNNPDLTDYQKLGYCDNNNFIEVWNNDTKYIIINPRKNYIYAPVNCTSFLYNYTSLTTCNIENFNTVNVTNMSSMFRDCSSLTSLDLSSFNTQNVTRMFDMFRGCTNLVSLNVSSFNTANVVNMDLMFCSLRLLTQLNVSNFNTAKVTTMFSMFENCNNLTELDLSSFNTANVTNIRGMFVNCNNLTLINISNFNTAKVSQMWQMFYNCVKLATIYANTFTLKTDLNSNQMFSNCTSLVGGNGTTYSGSYITAQYARIDGENGLPGYFTAPAANNK